MKKLLVFTLILLGASQLFAQNSRKISGTVMDSLGTVLQYTTVKLFSAQDTLTTTTDTTGKFSFPMVKALEFTLTVRLLGYEQYSKKYTVGSIPAVVLNTIKLKEAPSLLNEVKIVRINPVTIKEDTLQYDATAFKVREGAFVEDVFKKLPGIIVDKDGNVTSEGVQVSSLRVNGKDFFGGDVKAALKNLPADLIDKIQIIDDYGKQAQFTGIKTGEPQKIINLTIKEDKNQGYIGNTSLGKGNNGRYMGQLSANRFNEDQQISLLASLNNTNASMFGSESGSQSTGSDGISRSKSAGLNFQDDWGKKLEVNGSYRFSTRDNNTIGTSLQQNIFQDYTIFENESSVNSSRNSSHRFQWEMEYELDSLNEFELESELSFGSTSAINNGLTQIKNTKVTSLRNNTTSNNSTSPAINLEMQYNHRFRKAGRNFNLSTSLQNTRGNQNRDIRNNTSFIDSTGMIPVNTIDQIYQLIQNNNDQSETGVEFSYTEPLAKTTFLEFNYNYTSANTESIRDTRDVDAITGSPALNILQSNNYNYKFITNAVGVNLRVTKPKYNYTLGIEAQPVALIGQSVTTNISTRNNSFNLIPAARFTYNISRRNLLSLNYRGRSNQPGFIQLQPVNDVSNPQNITIGNPDLKPDFTHTVNLRYNRFNSKSGSSLLTNLAFNQTENRIVSSRSSVSNSTVQETRFINTDGFYAVAGTYTYSKPIADKKYTLAFNGGVNFNNNISFINNERNLGKNWILRQGLKFLIDLEDIIDAELSGTYSINKTNYSLSSARNTNANTFQFGVNGKSYILKNWTLGYDLSKTLNSGFSYTVRANPTILNTYVERRLLKGNIAAIRIQGFDLFNQNLGISRSVNGNQIMDTNNNRLARYFLASFNLRLQKFTGEAPDED